MAAGSPMLAASKVDGDRAWDEIHQMNQDQRFHLHPLFRLTGVGAIAGLYGFYTGGKKAYNAASLRFLAENSHRMPKLKGEWYFYYKRKNYVCAKAALTQGGKTLVRYGAIGFTYFGLEASLDWARGQIDFLNTIAATTISGMAYAKYYKLSRHGVLRMGKNGLIMGFLSGVVQDIMMYRRSGDLWYINSLKNLNALAPT